MVCSQPRKFLCWHTPFPDDTYLPPHCPTHPLQGQASLGAAPALAVLEVASPAPVADVVGLLEGPASFWRKQSAKVEKVLTEAPPGEWVCVREGVGWALGLLWGFWVLRMCVLVDASAEPACK